MNKYVDFKAFRKDVEKALAEISKQYGLNIHAGNITYDTTHFDLKLNCTRNDVNVEKINFNNQLLYMRFYGFTEDDYQKEYVAGTKRYKIIGFKPGNKYDVICRCGDKEYCCTHDSVLKAIGKETK